MTLRHTRLGRALLRSTPAIACCCLGLGIVGCSGRHFDLSRSLGLRKATTTEQIEDENIAENDEQDSAEPAESGRVVTAMVDRHPSPQAHSQDPFLSRGPGAAKPGQAVVNQSNELSDEELWRMFAGDAQSGVARVRREVPQNTQPQIASQDATQTSPSDIPVWAQSAAPSQPQIQRPARNRSLPPLSAMAEREIPSQPVANSPPPSGPRTTARPDRLQVSRAKLESLLAQARQRELEGDLFNAYRAAVLADELVARENLTIAAGEVQPSDVVRRIVERLNAAPEPKAVAQAAPPPLPPKPTTRPSAPAPSAVATATTRAMMQRDTAPPAPHAPFGAEEDPFHSPTWETTVATASVQDRPSDVFEGVGGLHEWRPAQANRPATLAERAAPENNDVFGGPVRQAAAAASETLSSLGQIGDISDSALWSGSRGNVSVVAHEQPVDVASGPSSLDDEVAPPPPLSIAQEHALAAQEEGVSADSRGSSRWWIWGSLAAVILGAVFLRGTNRPSSHES